MTKKIVTASDRIGDALYELLPRGSKRRLSVERSHPRIYRRLKTMGHSAIRTVEIMIDAKRGSRHALQWIRLVCRAGR